VSWFTYPGTQCSMAQLTPSNGVAMQNGQGVNGPSSGAANRASNAKPCASKSNAIYFIPCT
jgi:hypothetical protein